MHDPSTSSGYSPSAGSAQDALERALLRLRRRGADRRDSGATTSQLSPAAFRAVVDERLRGLQRQLDELKGRVNGLFMLLAGAVAAQVILRLIG